ncbi:hypothetical protein BV25DRAFT_1814097, partial [Artomyces pyxidatus]
SYDPGQDPEEKRVLRKNYRALMDTEGAHATNASGFTAKQLLDKVHVADTLFDPGADVSAPQQATLDSAFLLTASNVSAARARSMKTAGGGFDVDDFISKLITYMGGRRGELLHQGSDTEDEDEDTGLDWEKIGRKAMANSRRVPTTDFMLGPMSIEHKKRNVGKRAKLEKNKADERKPQELREDDIVRSENEPTKRVLTIKDILAKQDGPVNLFKFIINPFDFAQSVENLFHLSFLIQDGKCALGIEEGGNPVYVWFISPHLFWSHENTTVAIHEEPNDDDYEKGLKTQQFVLEFDMETWQKSIDVFKITQPMIPQRRKVVDTKGKWYA